MNPLGYSVPVSAVTFVRIQTPRDSNGVPGFPILQQAWFSLLHTLRNIWDLVTSEKEREKFTGYQLAGT